MNCCLMSRCLVWTTGTRGVLMENAAAAVAAVWPWEPGAASPTGMSPAPIYLFVMYPHIHKHACTNTLSAHGPTISLSFTIWAHCEVLNTYFHPVWWKLLVKFMGADCISILKECLEVTRTWACLRSKTDYREGPFNIKRTSPCWVLPVGCWRGSDQEWIFLSALFRLERLQRWFKNVLPLLHTCFFL